MKNVAALLCVTAAFAVCAPTAEAGTFDPPKPFAVFGDSLSDAGFFGLQATNGDVWAEQLGASTQPFSPVLNFAQGSARAVKGGDAPSGLAEQIDLFTMIAPPTGPDTHAVIWLGGNDLLAATQAVLGSGFDLGTPQGQQAALGVIGAAGAQAVAAIGEGIERLAAPGLGGITEFVVAGLPSLGLLPGFATPLLAPLAGAANAATAGFNAALQAEIAGLDAKPGLNVAYLDVDAIFADIIAGAPGNGFTDLQGDCLADGNFPACEGYVFADAIHPSEASHTILAHAFAERLPSAMTAPAPIPLPAGMALALAGLGALGALRLTRAA